MSIKRGPDRDLKILMSINGVEEPCMLTMRIEDDYLDREITENRIEQGLPVPDEAIPRLRIEDEIDEYRRIKNLERLEGERINKPEEEYDGKPDPGEGGWRTKSKTIEII